MEDQTQIQILLKIGFKTIINVFFNLKEINLISKIEINRKS